jgi:hypothetical protein
MEILLNDKVFTVEKIKSRMLRNAIDVQSRVNFDDLSIKDLDELVDLTCTMYGNQFTRDELYDGLDGDKLIDTLASTLNRTIDGVLDKLDRFPAEQ